MRYSKKFQIAMLALLLCFFSFSCISNVEEQLEELIEVSAKLSYKDEVQPILAARCLSCHSTGGSFPDISNFEKVKTHAGAIREQVVSGLMPRGVPLTKTQIKSIVDWVNAGALDN
jgi:mono/diheme cytochrome c family protein